MGDELEWLRFRDKVVFQYGLHIGRSKARVALQALHDSRVMVTTRIIREHSLGLCIQVASRILYRWCGQQSSPFLVNQITQTSQDDSHRCNNSPHQPGRIDCAFSCFVDGKQPCIVNTNLQSLLTDRSESSRKRRSRHVRQLAHQHQLRLVLLPRRPPNPRRRQRPPMVLRRQQLPECDVLRRPRGAIQPADSLLLCFLQDSDRGLH